MSHLPAPPQRQEHDALILDQSDISEVLALLTNSDEKRDRIFKLTKEVFRDAAQLMFDLRVGKDDSVEALGGGEFFILRHRFQVYRACSWVPSPPRSGETTSSIRLNTENSLPSQH